MLDRRSFIQQIVVSVPAVTALTALTKGAEAPQAPQPIPAPGTRRGFGMGGNVDPHFSGSPVGSQLPDQKLLVHDHDRPQPRKVTLCSPSQRLRCLKKLVFMKD